MESMHAALPAPVPAPTPGAAGRAMDVAISVPLSLSLAAVLVATSGTGRLPFLGWAAAFLFLAVESDLRSRRIPNWLTGASLAAALLAAGLASGATGLANALLGAGLALVLFFPLFAVRAMGAGDVKALAVLGAFFGVPILLPALWWMLVAAGLLALGQLLVRGELLELGRRLLVSLRIFARTGWFPRPALPARDAAARGIPFAPAMALGAAAYQAWGLPWA